MSNNTKKQSLLGKTPQKRKTPVKKPRNRPQTASQSSANPTSTPADQPVKSKKGLLITLAIIFAVAIIFPKPTLLTYKKLGMVSESIYWPGVFGKGAMLIDSNLHPQLDSKRKSLYLCSDLQKPQSCQKYQVIADNGLFAAIGSYF